jgi:hypothetical protein
MSQIVIDAAILQRLQQVQTTVELVDPAGKVVGHFVPATSPPEEPYISEEELQRREAEGGGRSLAEILADLEKRA